MLGSALGIHPIFEPKLFVWNVEMSEDLNSRVRKLEANLSWLKAAAVVGTVLIIGYFGYTNIMQVPAMVDKMVREKTETIVVQKLEEQDIEELVNSVMSARLGSAQIEGVRADFGTIEDWKPNNLSSGVFADVEFPQAIPEEYKVYLSIRGSNHHWRVYGLGAYPYGFTSSNNADDWSKGFRVYLRVPEGVPGFSSAVEAATQASWKVDWIVLH